MKGIILLKLTTERPEASRGLSATAELLVGIFDNRSGVDRHRCLKSSHLLSSLCVVLSIDGSSAC